MTNENGDVKFFGVPLEKWLNIFQTVGFPTLLVGFLLYMAWCYIPPVVAGHIKLLDRTGQTLESMDKTLQQSNEILSEVNEVEQETKAFMQTVIADHDKFSKKLDTNSEKLDANGKKTEESCKVLGEAIQKVIPK